ncbi:hypothetical protein DFH09DRAFT_1420435, partial [Mycena vulgaris]
PGSHHLLLVAFPAWGHTRPLCVLGGRLAAESTDVAITILMAPNWLEQGRLEITEQFPSGHEALRRIRIVSIFQSDAVRPSELLQPFGQFYPTAYQTLFRGKAITCATTGTTFDALPAPTALIIDFFSITQLHQTRTISGTGVPVFAFASCGSAALIRLFAPESLGGLGDFGARTDAEALRTGKSAADIGDQIFKHTDGTVIHVAGIPPMRDHEFFPQEVLVFPFILLAVRLKIGVYLNSMFMESDGIFIGTCEAYDKEALSALNHWISFTLKKPLYAVGPLLPPAYGCAGPSSSVAPHDKQIQTFLDNALTRHGKNSTLLILCHASPFATISPGLRDKIQASGVGMVTRWCPQQFILSHPATGWFMTHGGHGGISEALSNGIPLICWPFDGDQPAAAAHLTQTLDAAFHLVEVRTGKGLRPLFSGQVPRGTREAVGAEFRRTIEECRGAVGERKRKNAGRVRVEFAKAWEEGGTARIAIHIFCKRYVHA